MIKTAILRHYRSEGASIKEIANKYGYPESSIEKVIFPNGKHKITVTKVKVSQPIPKEEKKKNPVMINAGKKAWETRRKNQKSPSAIRDDRKTAKILLGIAIIKLNEALSLLK